MAHSLLVCLVSILKECLKNTDSWLEHLIHSLFLNRRKKVKSCYWVQNIDMKRPILLFLPFMEEFTGKYQVRLIIFVPFSMKSGTLLVFPQRPFPLGLPRTPCPGLWNPKHSIEL